MHRWLTRYGALSLIALTACGEDAPVALSFPDASVDRHDASVPDVEIAPDAGPVDTGVHPMPVCEPGMVSVELPLPRAVESGAVFAQPGGVVYENGTPTGVFSWTWVDRSVTPLGPGRLIAADHGRTLYDSGRKIVFVGGAETSTFAGQSFGFSAQRPTLAQPYGAEFFQSEFVAWPGERAFRITVNTFDYQEERRETGLVDIGPAVSSHHIAWLATSTSSSDEWHWVVENQRTRKQFETRITKLAEAPKLKLTDNVAYTFQEGRRGIVLQAWQFAEGTAPIEIPTELYGNCQFLAGPQALLQCNDFRGSLYSLTANRVNIIRTGGGHIRGASQSDGRVLFVEVDGREGRVVVLDLTTGERTELIDTFTLPGAAVRTSLVDDIAVWSFDGRREWGAALLCP